MFLGTSQQELIDFFKSGVTFEENRLLFFFYIVIMYILIYMMSSTDCFKQGLAQT